MDYPSGTDCQVSNEQFNATDEAAFLGHCLHKLVEQTVEKHTDKIALICAGQEFTYGELNDAANRAARVLQDQGVSRGDVVGVAMDRSLNLVVVLLAVLKAGAAYTPIDPSYPASRVRYMLEDAAPKLVIFEKSTQDMLSFWENGCMAIDQLLDNAGKLIGNKGNIHVAMYPDDLAYIMYTSGSTGKPKGVEINHGAICNLLLGMAQRPGCVETDRLLAITTISFDISLPELFMTLICGATSVIAQTHELKDPAAILVLMRRYAINIMTGTPSFWHMLLDARWNGEPRLSTLVSCADTLSRQLADRLLHCAVSVWNAYGPTEATVNASAWKVQPEGVVQIGRPLSNYRLYVLNEDLSPAPPGCAGELYIGGASLARGYRNKPELSCARFPNNPYHDGLMYRTGDLARFSSPDQLSIIGRMDWQIKIRGHRIELGDVEATIDQHPDILETIATGVDDRLVVYCRRRSKDTDHAHKIQTTLEAILRPWLAERLPAYMMPAFFVEMETFPFRPNGKVDRSALPSPVQSLGPGAAAATKTPVERQLRIIWAAILGHDRIGINDNFFQIGGDSLKAVKVLAEIDTSLGHKVSPAKFFEHYTIKAMAAYLDQSAETKAQHVDSQQNRQLYSSESLIDYDDRIAVVSMACRLPGGVCTPEGYWEVLEQSMDVITDVPKDRWDAEMFHDDDPHVSGKSYCRQGGFLDSVHGFDASFFGISPVEASCMHPAQRIMLETCWEGFEKAGYTIQELQGSHTGVYIGISNISAHADAWALENLNGYALTGSAGGTMSGRISYVLGLEGPALTIDTACSSSLVTTHLACNALRRGECDMAVSGGVTLMLNPAMHVEFSRVQGLSQDGRCRAFAQEAQGTGWAEGCTAVVLKRLNDALRDGDRIEAVIRGTAVNHGGRSAAGLTVPSGRAQERLIRTALSASRLHPSDIDYVEAHGTGTRLGDPIEGAALAVVFTGSRNKDDTEPLWIGASKSNLGHTQAAAGLAGLLKVVLAMQKNLIPRTLHVENPTPMVDWQAAGMALVQEHQPWTSRAGRVRRAGISSFGIGGTNAHIVVEEPPIQLQNTTTASSSLPTELPFLLSARSTLALQQQAERFLHHVQSISEQNDDRLADIAWSLATTRNHFDHRLVIMAKNKSALIRKLTSLPKASNASDHFCESRIAMLFTGQGSQIPEMGKGLYQTYPVFRKALDKVVSHFDGMPLVEIMHAPEGSEKAAYLRRTDFAQSAIFALEVALWHLWQSWDVKPAFLLGHSVGELAAAHVAGVLDLPDACRLVGARGRLMQAVSCNGSMVSLEAGAEETAQLIANFDLQHTVCIAAHNTPVQTVISGDSEAVERIALYMASCGRKTKSLDVARAFHSHHMDTILSDFESVAKSVQFHAPHIPLVSSVTGALIEANHICTPEYWVQQVRKTVCFADGIQALFKEGVQVFLEIGPQSVLAGLGAACLTSKTDISWLSSLVPGKFETSTMLQSLISLHLQHVAVDWKAFFEPYQSYKRVELPTYAFQRSIYPTIPPTRDNRPLAVNGGHAPNHFPKTSDVDHLQFEIGWHKAGKQNATPRGFWGLLCPQGNPAWEGVVAEALTKTGVFLRRVSRLEEADNVEGLICIWNWDTVEHQDRVGDAAADLTARALQQLQTVTQTGFTPILIWITRNSVSINSTVSGLGATPLWGLARTARHEHPDLSLRLIDVDEESSLSGALSQAVALGNEPECMIRQGQVLTPKIQAMRESSPRKQLCIHPDSSVLVTGGLGGIGKKVALRLAATHGIRHLILTSRNGIKTPGAQDIVTELAKIGSKATVIACDVSELESVKTLMASLVGLPPLRGIVHAAGITDDGILQALTPSRCAAVLAPKVRGAWNLHQLTLTMKLDFFVMFSSISGIIGLPGQGNYAAANTFLDALAHVRQTQGLPATSIAYGAWEGDGMASRINRATKVRFAQLGLNPLRPDEGLELFSRAMSAEQALMVAATLDVDQLKIYFEERGGTSPVFSPALGQVAASAGKSWGLREALENAAPEKHSDIVLTMVQETVAKALGFELPSDVNVKQSLQDIGIDSLTAVLMRNQLASLTGLTLTARFAFQHPHLESLSMFLLSEIQKESSASSSGGTGTAPTSPATSDMPYLDITAIENGNLDPTFTFVNTKRPGSCSRTALVTGATGFIGAFIVNGLLNSGMDVYCLIRADNDEHATQRLVSSLSNYGLWRPEYAPLLHAIAGEMEQPLFGISWALFTKLANEIDMICHSAGLVDWVCPLKDYVGPNLVSTHEVLRLASQGCSKTVHLISTMSTLPKYMGYELTERDQEYGYATSKYRAERMVAAARWRGAQASIYRLPFVTASSLTGHFRQNRGDFLHNLVAGCLEMGSFPSFDATLSTVLPVDYVANTIVAMMTRDLDSVGYDYDFVNGTAPSFKQYFRLLSRASTGQSTIAVADWRAKVLAHVAEHVASPLARIGTILDAIIDEKTAAAVFTGSPVGSNVLGTTRYPVPCIDQQSVCMYVDRIRAAG